MSKFPTIPEVTEHQRVASVLLAALQEQLRRDRAQAMAFTTTLDAISRVIESGGTLTVSYNTYEHREALAPLMAAYGVEFVPHEREIGVFRIAKIGADLDSMMACEAQPAAGVGLTESAIKQAAQEICGIQAKITVDPDKLTHREWNFPKGSR